MNCGCFTLTLNEQGLTGNRDSSGVPNPLQRLFGEMVKSSSWILTPRTSWWTVPKTGLAPMTATSSQVGPPNDGPKKVQGGPPEWCLLVQTTHELDAISCSISCDIPNPTTSTYKHVINQLSYHKSAINPHILLVQFTFSQGPHQV